MRFSLILFLFGLTCSALAQPKYPVKTIFKGDSVVILKASQFNRLNSRILAQDSRIKNMNVDLASLKIEIDRLSQENIAMKVDLLTTRADQPRRIDSAITSTCGGLTKDLQIANAKIKLIDDWLLETAVGNAYLYFDWKDSTVKAVDLTLYASEFDHDLGSLTFIRRGANSDYPEFRKRLWQYPESPDRDWSMVRNEDMRPFIYEYLHKIKMKNPFLGEFMKNPYIR